MQSHRPSHARYRKAKASQRRRKAVRLFWLALALTPLVYLGISQAARSNPTSRAAGRTLPAAGSPSSDISHRAAPVASSATLAADVQHMVDAHPELQLEISVLGLRNAQSAGAQDNQPLLAASTTKLLPAILYLKQVQSGSASLDDPLGDYTAGFQLQQLINQSNNDSWDLFNSLVSLQAQQEYLHQLGLNSYQWQQNSVSPRDLAALLGKLYRGELLDPDHTQLLLSYMQNTEEEGYIPAGLPSGRQDIKLYHKVGLLDDTVNDAAVIDDGTHAFVLAIFSNGHGFPDYPDRATLYQQITQTVLKDEGVL